MERETGNIDQPGGFFDVLLHQVEQVGAAGDELGAGMGGEQEDRVGDISGAGILEVDHGSPMACRMAATMLG